MTAVEKADGVVDRVAERLQRTADRFAAEGGAKAKLAETLAEDAAFLRQLKPSLIRARMRGEAPTDGAPARGALGRQGMTAFGGEPPQEKGSSGDGPNPFVVVAAAFAVGIVVAKVIDWRGHAHPRI